MNKKVILYIATSLDGFIARKNGSVDWLSPYENGGEDYGYQKFYDSVGTVVMGNTTYEQARALGESYHGKNCVVFSRRKNNDKKRSITFVNGDVGKIIKELDPENDKNVWLVGGASIIDQFRRDDLIDELIISIIPTLLGDGISLFKGDHAERQLKLLDIKSFASGVVQLHYECKRLR